MWYNFPTPYAAKMSLDANGEMGFRYAARTRDEDNRADGGFSAVWYDPGIYS